MKFKEIYNPKHVYEGFFETYFIRPFFHHYADFRSKESPDTCGKSLLAWLVVTLGIAGILMGQIGLIGPEAGTTISIVIGIIWIAFSLVPVIAVISRTANGSPSKPLQPRMLGVDTLLGVSCLLFFLLGLLMMVTTLNSGSLNPNAGMTDEPDTAVIEEEYIKEEPIFTYQDEAPAPVTNDSMSDMTEPDFVDPDESFDPSLEAPADEIIADPSIDSL